jgi:hypothetical protein
MLLPVQRHLQQQHLWQQHLWQQHLWQRHLWQQHLWQQQLGQQFLGPLCRHPPRRLNRRHFHHSRYRPPDPPLEHRLRRRRP